MSAKEELFKFLEEEKKWNDAKTPQILAEWKAELKKLFQQFREWLKGSEHLLSVSLVEHPINEEKIGNYNAPFLKILSPSGRSAKIQTIARFCVGSLGRVDFSCGCKKVRLVQTSPGRWSFCAVAFQPCINLTEESFWGTLQQIWGSHATKTLFDA